eukprot:428027_1
MSKHVSFTSLPYLLILFNTLFIISSPRTTGTTCHSSVYELTIGCEDNSDCPDCMQCCPKRKLCEYPNSTIPNSTIPTKAMLPDFIAPVAPKSNYNYYGYIILIGVIAFVLINNIFFGCWCITRQKK